MNLLVLGDLHGQLGLVDHYHAIATKRFALDIEAALLLGDIGLYRDVGEFPDYVWGKRQLPVYCLAVHGNHESLPIVNRLARRKIVVPDLALFGMIEMEHFTRLSDGYDKGDNVVQVMGVGGAYAAPGTNTSGQIPFDETVPRQHLAWYRDYRAAFAEPNEPAVWGYKSAVMDIMIAHECPTGFGAIGDPAYGDPFNCGSAALGELWRDVRPKIALSGHYHRFHDHRDPDGLRWVILPGAEEMAAVLDTETWQLTTIAYHGGTDGEA